MSTSSIPVRWVLFTVLVTGGVLAARAPRTDEVQLGQGRHVYTWSSAWTKAVDAQELGNTHGCVLVDRAGRVYVNTDTAAAVVILSPEGARLGAWGADLAGGLHGMVLREEDGQEFLYATHTGRHEALKLTLDGKLIWSVGWPEASGLYESADQYHPTSIAVRADGGFFVADGYGKSWIHMYDAERKYLRSFGGPGDEPGQLATPHGIWIDTRGEQPLLLVADREHGRVQRFDMQGRFVDVLNADLKRPCHMHAFEGDLAVPELAGGVAILGAKGELLLRLGENPEPSRRAQNGISPDVWAPGEFLSPHCASFDASGNLYVVDWNARGRISKLVRGK